MAMALAHLFLLIQFILLPSSCIIAVQVGSFLYTNDSKWLSPSGDFAIGLRQVEGNDTYYRLSVWYDKINETIIWYAGEDGEVLAPKESWLTCNIDIGLVLNDPQGDVLLSLGRPTNGTEVADCSLDDNGNLIVVGTQNETIWESFKHPRDTLMPSQKIWSSDLGGPVLYSRLSENEFKRGKFELRFFSNGSFILNTRNIVADNPYDNPYYTRSPAITNDSINSESPGYAINYDVSGGMYIITRNGSNLVNLSQGKNFPTPSNNYHFRATLNYDGVLAWYYHKKGDSSGTWSVLNFVPEDICHTNTGTMDGGVCGFNSICSLINSSNGYDYPKVTCDCPQMYSKLQPNDSFGGCKPDFKLPSFDAHVGYKLEEIKGVDFPLRAYELLDPFSEEDCKKACLDDYMCMAAITSGLRCWKKSLPLLGGRTNYTRITFLKVSDGHVDENLHRILVFMGASVFSTLLLVFGAILGIRFFCKRGRNDFRVLTKTKDLDLVAWNSSCNVSCFAYKELETATHGFKEELGRGACAIVYKGVIDGSQTLVAVKKIDRAVLREADKEFETEVSVIGKTRHKNLVRLIGFCHEDEHRILVYELMMNGSLADVLFGETRPSWLVRVQVAKGVARGLLYLHEDCDSQIIHCDIKPQNILLNENFEARISDFGLSKLLMMKQFQTHTAIRGTKGYVAPEWFRNKPVTVKVDVYSFGVVLLELISCRRCIYSEPNEEERVILTEWAFHCYQSGDLSSLLDNEIEALDDRMQLEKLLKVAFWCIQEDPNLRPTMRQVSLMLEGVIEVCDPPNLDQDTLSVSNSSDYCLAASMSSI